MILLNLNHPFRYLFVLCMSILRPTSHERSVPSCAYRVTGSDGIFPALCRNRGTLHDRFAESDEFWSNSSTDLWWARV